MATPRVPLSPGAPRSARAAALREVVPSLAAPGHERVEVDQVRQQVRKAVGGLASRHRHRCSVCVHRRVSGRASPATQRRRRNAGGHPVHTATAPAGALLGDVLAAQSVVGEVVWDRGQEGTLRCEARTVTAAIRFSRSGRQHDYTAAALQIVELVPLDGVTPPLVLATTLPVDTLAAVKGVVRVYSWRWAIETAFETMKAWGLGRFMVRS